VFASSLSVLKAKMIPIPIFIGRLCSGNGYIHTHTQYSILTEEQQRVKPFNIPIEYQQHYH